MLDDKDIEVLKQLIPGVRCAGALACYRNGRAEESFKMGILAVAFEEVERKYFEPDENNYDAHTALSLWSGRIGSLVQGYFVGLSSGESGLDVLVTLDASQKSKLEKNILCVEVKMQEENLTEEEIRLSLYNLGREVREAYDSLKNRNSEYQS